MLIIGCAAGSRRVNLSRSEKNQPKDWRRDGVARRVLKPVPIAADADVLTPDDIMAGTMPRNRNVLVYDDDHYYLGGVIAFRQQRLDDAQRDFDAAIELEGRHCEAHFDRAALRLTRKEWPAAAAGFDEAFECLTARTPTLEQRIADAREARLSEEARAALVKRREQSLRDHRFQIAWARYNGGVAYANVGKLADARSRADEAIAIGGPAGEAALRLLPQLQR